MSSSWVVFAAVSVYGKRFGRASIPSGEIRLECGDRCSGIKGWFGLVVVARGQSVWSGDDVSSANGESSDELVHVASDVELLVWDATELLAPFTSLSY